MNWLAHVFLSEQNIDFQIGNYLADPLKGKSWDTASSQLKLGIQTHIMIDSYTDSHNMTALSKSRLGEKGLLKSIVIDITYDYFLTKNWDTFCNITFKDFTNKFYLEANNSLSYLPKNAKDSVSKLIKFNILNNYQSLEHLNRAFQRFDKRLSPRLLARDTASSYYHMVKKNINDLEDDFMIFFPDLCSEVKKKVNKKNLEHWKL